MQSQLFQAFNRLGQERSGEEGTGIGLVMSKRFVELMGGEIGVKSEGGHGSVFWFELNSSSAPKLEHDHDFTPDVASTPANTEKVRRTLLYVEDNPANLELVRRLIDWRPDVVLLSAVDGPSGIALAREYLPDMRLMDMNLPGISGIEALQILRACPEMWREGYRRASNAI